MSSHEGCREDSCVVAAGNHVYVYGGNLAREYFSKAERFDTVENKWEEIANMHRARRCAFGVATEGKIWHEDYQTTKITVFISILSAL